MRSLENLSNVCLSFGKDGKSLKYRVALVPHQIVTVDWLWWMRSSSLDGIRKIVEGSS